jgi:hypothetical protein
MTMPKRPVPTWIALLIIIVGAAFLSLAGLRWLRLAHPELFTASCCCPEC